MMSLIRRTIGVIFILPAILSLLFQPAAAQSSEPLVIVLSAEGPIMPPMREYIQRGIEAANRRNAEAIIIELNTPGGSIDTMLEIITAMRASEVPVIVYVYPRNAIAGSAGAMITLAGHAAAMAPETSIGASSPIDSSGENLTSTAEAKNREIIKAAVRDYVRPRGEQALALAEAMVDEAKAVTASEALDAHLIDFVVDNVDDLLEALDGFTVQMKDGPRTLATAHAVTEPFRMSLIEQFLLFLTDPNIVFTLLSVGITAILIEISSPGGWVAGFIGVVCVTVALYGIGLLPVNWFGILFLLTAFALFILDIKAPTHGALTAAGVASFIVGALVLFNSPGAPEFQRVSVPLVVGTGVAIGLMFLAVLMFALRALRRPVSAGVEAYIGKTGTVVGWDEAGGQVQLQSELWSAEKAEASDKIRKGDRVEVVEVKGLRLKVRKIK
ncbi:MAG: NfeD family protein [Chloroflexota bacterium]|nr:nodulation protein NfeD [Chloroflexota bacterium]MBI5704416.1 nodulation protein NfeD [Chloroflexota bacterium]